MHFYFRVVILMIIFLPGHLVYASQKIVELKKNSNRFILHDYFEILNDRERNFTINQVMSPSLKNEYFSVAPQVPNFGFTKNTYWLKFIIFNQNIENEKWFLNIEYPHHDFIDLYTYQDNREIDHYQTGRLLPFATRSYEHANFILPLKIPPKTQTYTYYIKVAGSGAKIIQARLQNQDNLDVYNQRRNIAYGLYYGIMLAMIVYNLLMLFSMKKNTYFFYIIFIVSINFMNGSLHGLTYQFFWPRHVWWNYISVPFFIGTTSLTSILFCISFLRTIRNININLIPLKILAGVAVIVILLSLMIGQNITRIFVVNIGMALSVIFSFTILSTSVFAVMKKKLQNFSFFLGWLILPICIILTVLKSSGFIQHTDLTENILPAGMLLQSFIFSFSLNENVLLYQKEKAQAQKRAILNLKKSDAIKNEFLAKTSHEIKTPLHGILGISESILNKNDEPLSPNVLGSLNIINASARRLLYLINDILDVTRLNNEDLRLIKKCIHLPDLLNIVLPLIKESVSNKNITIINRISEKFPAVYCDDNRIQQVFINLLSNAIKFTPSGRIVIHGAMFNETHAIIHIRDTGIGIEQKNQDKIFRIFEQIDSGLSKKYSGMGLGLNITKQLIELHSGEIFVSSKPGKGSRFSFTLPLCNDSLVQEVTYAENSLKQIQPVPQEVNETRLNMKLEHIVTTNSDDPHLFIVDDEPLNIEILVRILGKLKYQITKVNSGKECLALLSTLPRKPDLILLDIMMPEMSGFEVVKKIRENYNLYDMPVILITALNDVNNIKLGFECGANDYIPKPFHSDELIARIGTLIKLKKAIINHNELLYLKKDMEMAVKLQDSILPDNTPLIKNIECSFTYIPMTQIGGDYYDYMILSENKIGFIIADVSGHGMAAALVASMIKILYTGLHNEAENPSRLLQTLNNKLYNKTGTAFLTAFYLYLDLGKKEMVYSNAGHPYSIYYNKEKGTISRLKTTGGAIGFQKNINPGQMSMEISNGDRLVLYTDGLTEAYEQIGYDSGEDHLIQLIQDGLSLTPNEAAKLILDDYYLNIKTPHDDVTMIIVDIL